ncbi:unnamed protein product [Bursaphelenchus okinawaensis]|uniref:Poly(A) RNA polymerase mitochondrial-like central palm domain-containing protein n=1 Tax=Bursaphelenchus okinawaensis TaxID=465554 RepID=A0A811LMX5_9BILA|nr:unnamed protein product [Bursaphelenchus okinawaensis]CAG9124503.1 unnamed protein product [Bursaphelenchus okinawaensis]
MSYLEDVAFIKHATRQLLRYQKKHLQHQAHAVAKINKICESQRQSEEEKQLKEELVHVFEKDLKAFFGQTAKVTMYGGSVNGFGSKNSDIDACIEINIKLNPETTEEREANTQLLELVQERINKKKDSMITKYKNLRLIKAKVPIICTEMYHPMARQYFEVDLSCANQLAKMNTRLLQEYSRLDDRVKNLFFLVKKWLKKNHLYGSVGCMNSYSIINLVIYYLQRGVHPQILPVMHNLVPDLENKLKNKDNICCKWTPQNTEMTTLLLFIGFVTFYNRFRFRDYEIDIREASLKPRQTIKHSIAINCPVNGMVPSRGFFAVNHYLFKHLLRETHEVFWYDIPDATHGEKGRILHRFIGNL